MPDKKFNKTNSWQEKLEELDRSAALPDFNKGAAWDKLHARLGQPAKKKNNAWYWMAAAAILTAAFLAIPWMNPVKKQSAVPIVRQQPILKPILTAPGIALPQSQQGLTGAGIPGGEKPKNIRPRNLPVNPVVPGNAPESEELKPATATAQIIPHPPAIIENKTDSPFTALVQAVQPQKKMTVVYLNEIEAGGNDMMPRQAQQKKRRPHYPKIGQSGDYDVYATKIPERFTISLSSAN
jgi:hypothetical protein